MSNVSMNFDLPPLPAYTLTPRPLIIPPIPDYISILILPVVAYWVMSMVFHWIDVNDYFPQYRLHTPAEVLKRNHVSRWHVVRDVIVQQIIQTAFGLAIGYWEDMEHTGREEHDIAVWARRVRIAQMAVPRVISLVGIDAAGLAKYLSAYPVLAGALAGGRYPSLTQSVIMETGVEIIVPTFARWELVVAGITYWYLVPILQFLFAILFVDTWQYFLHRAMHTNRWLYTTFHSRHHRLYVPYAFGALYNHPFEGFLLDTAGTGLAFLLTGMTSRQGMWFFTCSTIKTVDDHCGYAFPWDPLQHITSNNAAYHDIHHQSWGIKSNFSQPFFTFWDRFLGTCWMGGDINAKYARSRTAAERLVEQDKAKSSQPQPENIQSSMQQHLSEASAFEGSKISLKDDDELTRTLLPRSVRRKATPFTSQADSLKGISHRMNGSIRQK